MHEELSAFEGKEACSRIRGTFPYMAEVPAFEAKCRDLHDGVMQSGISNAMVVTYRFLGEMERQVGDFDKEASFFRSFFEDTDYMELLELVEYVINYGLNYLQERSI